MGWAEDQDVIFGGPDRPEDRHRGFDRDPEGGIGQPTVPRRRPVRNPVRVIPMFNDQGFGQALSGFNMAQAMAGQQGGHLAGLLNQTMGAIGDENDRRVALSREMRRMEFEQWKAQQALELEKMRLENERQRARDEAANQIRMLRYRDAAEQRQSGVPVRRSFQMDPYSGQYRWMEDWEM